jgi:putative effector of murein hydrolase
MTYSVFLFLPWFELNRKMEEKIMVPLLALTIVFFVYAIGDLVATKTKAIISMMLVCSVVFLIAFWCGLPATIFSDSGLTAFSSVTICMFLVHVGSTIKVKDFFKEWKTVVIVLLSTLAIAFGVYFVGKLFMDKYYALVAGPTVAGGMVAYLVMQTVGDTLGRSDVTVFSLMVLSFQAFIGVPIASFLCKKEGSSLLQDWKDGKYVPEIQDEKEGKFSKFKIFANVPEKYNSANLILFKTALIALIAQQLANLTGVNQLIFALVLGVFFHEIGLLDDACLTKANGFSFVIAGALCNVFSGLANTTPGQLVSMLLDIILVFVIGVAVAAVVSIVVGKFLHFSWRLSLAVAITALFGFPGTYLVSREVASAVGKDDEEAQVVMSYLMPKMVIAGIVSVSVVSGLAASIMCGWI